MDTQSRLKRLECPVNWNLHSILAEKGCSPREKLLCKLGKLAECTRAQAREITGDGDSEHAAFDSSSAWQTCSQLLTLAWLEYPGNKMIELLLKLEDFIKANMKIPLIAQHLNALTYVINSMWAHFYYQGDNIEKAEEYLQSLDFDDMDEKNKAAVMAFKSCVFMEFGPTDLHDGAFTAIDKALDLQDSQREWHFIKGKGISRTRRCRNNRSAPSDEELIHLRKAVEMNQSDDVSNDQGRAWHFVYCGQSVKEYALYSSEASANDDVQKLLLKESEYLIRKAVDLGHDSPILLTRIAKGVMNLKSGDWTDVLEPCICRSLELLPESGLVNHVAGMFYMFQRRDNEKALFRLAIAALDKGLFGAYINLIDLKWRTSSDDIEPIVESFWETFKNDSLQKIKAYPVMAAFHFFVKNNLMKAVSFWREWMRSGEGTYSRKCGLFVMCSDLTEPLVGEVRSLLNSNSNISRNDEIELREFLDEVYNAKPRLLAPRNRKRIIQLALSKLDSQTKMIVAPKLPDITSSTPNPGLRSPRTTPRELPLNWRQP